MIINPIDSTAGQSFRSSFSNISEERPSRMHQVDSASSEIEIEKEVDDLLASQISLLPHIIVLYMVVFLKYLEKKIINQHLAVVGNVYINIQLSAKI